MPIGKLFTYSCSAIALIFTSCAVHTPEPPLQAQFFKQINGKDRSVAAPPSSTSSEPLPFVMENVKSELRNDGWKVIVSGFTNDNTGVLNAKARYTLIGHQSIDTTTPLSLGETYIKDPSILRLMRGRVLLTLVENRTGEEVMRIGGPASRFNSKDLIRQMREHTSH
ncbi:hypothetical protein ABGM91_11440 [Akkermansia muciniphila]|uniref:hypothetical protein n=1 Tax=Akkermansia muciniphila TaxID=239935 RepID=UPI0033BB0B4B